MNEISTFLFLSPSKKKKKKKKVVAKWKDITLYL